MRLLLALFIFASVSCSILVLASLTCSAQPIVKCINAYNIHEYWNNTTRQIRNYTQIMATTNVFSKTEQIDWVNIPGYRLSPAIAYITNYYIWSHAVTVGGPLVVDHNVQWTATPGLYGGHMSILQDQPLPPGISPVYPSLRTSMSITNTPFQSMDQGDSEWLLFHSTNGPFPSPVMNWYFKFRVTDTRNGRNYSCGFVLYPGQIVYVSTPYPVYFTDWLGESLPGGHICNGPFVYGPVEDIPNDWEFNRSPNVDNFVPVTIPTVHYILDDLIPGFFDR